MTIQGVIAVQHVATLTAACTVAQVRLPYSGFREPI
ncbi:Uncharacterised protein [Mycobacteroides abscessus subsp. massiliense]|nr:Uncharacterised protein [Mycobacteroides abscessus subsp. massiliense]